MPGPSASSEISPRDRCPEHNLAVGPTGECVLCRRQPPGQAAHPRWLSPVLLAAGLGTALLGGVVLGRRHAPPPPVAEPTTAETVQPVEPPVDEKPVAVLTEPRPREVPAPPVPAPTHAPPPRDYLDEAWAAIPKGNLYDDAPAHPAQAQPSPSSSAPMARPRGGMGRGGGRRH